MKEAILTKQKDKPATKDWSVREIKVSHRAKNKTGVYIRNHLEAYSVIRRMWDSDLINIQEQIGAIFLTNANEVLGFRIISTGKLDACLVNRKLIAAIAIKTMSKAVILVHNHPSGKLKPSEGDKKATIQIKRALELVDCELLDHLIISENDYLSMAAFLPADEAGYFFDSND